ncbi:hypothetical protein C2845_PM03G17890 [Panicum miliaceum]|uniref:Uncharacterized protein n=1 Tax=Panicum miliaceum TaxID=4540 RepID=A0A3L6TCX0_PANMI|nr:hypothetical protein C2845_PM03G17890 [Panicum miliaceum]
MPPPPRLRLLRRRGRTDPSPRTLRCHRIWAPSPSDPLEKAGEEVTRSRRTSGRRWPAKPIAESRRPPSRAAAGSGLPGCAATASTPVARAHACRPRASMPSHTALPAARVHACRGRASRGGGCQRPPCASCSARRRVQGWPAPPGGWICAGRELGGGGAQRELGRRRRRGEREWERGGPHAAAGAGGEGQVGRSRRERGGRRCGESEREERVREV